jgi:putative component of membrane protein insertase Oxa1/YidC/SpoIIIJ protein YidD
MTGTYTISPAGTLAAGLIRLYQRFISPYKGFSCAYRVKKKRCSCSEFARRVATRFGLLKLPDLLQRRFKKCGRAAKVLDYESKAKPEPAKKRQSSFDCSPDPFDCARVGCDAASGCDVPSGGCDVPGCDIL